MLRPERGQRERPKREARERPKRGQRERESEWRDKFQPFLNFKAQSAFDEIEMKQKQNRNLIAHD